MRECYFYKNILPNACIKMQNIPLIKVCIQVMIICGCRSHGVTGQCGAVSWKNQKNVLEPMTNTNITKTVPTTHHLLPNTI